MMKTQEEYLAASNKCPFCHSWNINGMEAGEIEGNGASQEVACGDCRKHWRDLYTLTGYEEVI